MKTHTVLTLRTQKIGKDVLGLFNNEPYELINFQLSQRCFIFPDTNACASRKRYIFEQLT